MARFYLAFLFIINRLKLILLKAKILPKLFIRNKHKRNGDNTKIWYKIPIYIR